MKLLTFITALFLSIHLLLPKTTRANSTPPNQAICSTTGATRTLWYDMNRVIIKKQEEFYSFLDYEECTDDNDYFEHDFLTSHMNHMPMLSNKLSPVCTHVSLKHDALGKTGQYLKSCNDKPEYTAHKPCVSKNYHRFVHNQIVRAAECFKVDTKSLFSLFATESYLQVNINASGKDTAQGIGQQLKAYKDVNSDYEAYLNYFQKNAPNTLCLNHISELMQIPKLEDHNSCSPVNIDQRVKQDIFYTVAYRLKNITLMMETLMDQENMFTQPVEKFSKKYPKANGDPNDKSPKEIFNEFSTLAKTVKSGLDQRTKIGGRSPEFTSTLYGKYFGELDAVTCNENNKPYCQFDKHPFVKKHCQGIIESPKKADSIENESIERYIDKIDDYSTSVTDCLNQKTNAYLDLYFSLDDDRKKIFDELSFYTHNRGPSARGIFSQYANGIGENLTYDRFTGTHEGSFRSFMTRYDAYQYNQKNPDKKVNALESQGSNFIFNNPDQDAKGSKSSTQNNMGIIRRGIASIDENGLTNDRQTQYLSKIKTPEGFAHMCSPY